EKSPGTLDITHNQYACTPADDINVIPVIPQDSNATSPTSNKAYVSLLNGQIMGYGYASSLQFRDRDFGYPLTVVIKEGHFALLTGLLSSFLTIVIGRLVLQFKKNSR
ncbi:MAG TPA: hypothetical protein VK436_11490, partial [Methanocella sp.]|nr:hypothetical protein [Methanocella sp.]